MNNDKPAVALQGLASFLRAEASSVEMTTGGKDASYSGAESAAALRQWAAEVDAAQALSAAPAVMEAPTRMRIYAAAEQLKSDAHLHDSMGNNSMARHCEACAHDLERIAATQPAVAVEAVAGFVMVPRQLLESMRDSADDPSTRGFAAGLLSGAPGAAPIGDVGKEAVKAWVREQGNPLLEYPTAQPEAGKPRFIWTCSEGCGECGVKRSEFEYLRTEDLAGNLLESKTIPRLVSQCCGKTLVMWDNEKDEEIDVDVEPLIAPDAIRDAIQTAAHGIGNGGSA